MVDVSCYTFGAPRTGNHAFAKEYNAAVPDTWSVINDQVSILFAELSPPFFRFGPAVGSARAHGPVQHCISWQKPADLGHRF